MNEKRSTVFTIAVIASVFLIFTAADLIQGDRVFSETENRLLASRPGFTMEALFKGKYTEDYEKYITDQFVSRDKWITLKTYTDVALGRQEINGVYLGKEDYLFEQHLPESYPAELAEEKLDLLRILAVRWNAGVMLVPSAGMILEDRLPEHAPRYDETELLEMAEAMLGQDRYIDVYKALREHEDEEIYYRTDHHWTSLGAYYGYLAWLETWEEKREKEQEEEKALGLEREKAEKERRRFRTEGMGLFRDRFASIVVLFPEEYYEAEEPEDPEEGQRETAGVRLIRVRRKGQEAGDGEDMPERSRTADSEAPGVRAGADERDVSSEKPARYGKEAQETVSEDFLGTLHSKINMEVKPDSIQYFPETMERPVKVTYDLRNTADTCYEESYLDTKNQYGFFLDDNHAIVQIDTEYRNGRTLFVIKDSYANCFVPLLIPYYQRIYVMDLRYYNGRLFKYMESCEPEEGMDVLVLYNCIHFLEDFLYVK